MDKTGTSMRDSFFDGLYDVAKRDRDVVLVSADMNALSLDKFMRDLGGQYVDAGIAEQNAVLVAAGMAKEGKKPYVYAIAPFVTTRVHEFAKIELSLMKLPITIVGVGAGLSYDEAGPTHHTTEDISIMRALPKFNILSPSDAIVARRCADISHRSDNPSYVRLDRQSLPPIYDESEAFEKGFHELKKGKDLCIVSTGNMVHNALEVQKDLKEKGRDVGLIDVHRLKPLSKEFIGVLRNYNQLVSAEEHLLEGGLGSIIAETIVDGDLPIKLHRIGLEGYHYFYGTREEIQEQCGLDSKSIMSRVEKFV
tara:strand:+ start:37096 stop:38022 length:927 start_codon:yes stop_codon:yes gene_type:complete